MQFVLTLAQHNHRSSYRLSPNLTACHREMEEMDGFRRRTLRLTSYTVHLVIW